MFDSRTKTLVLRTRVDLCYHCGPRGLQNQDLANETGTLCVDAIFDRITIQNPVTLFYCCITPHIRPVFYVKKIKTFGMCPTFYKFI
jgi:hypothetical protein